VEILMGVLVSGIVVGAVVMLLQHGLLLTASNTAYSAAQSGAFSSMELLTKEIASAGEVEIISSDAHVFKTGLEDEWGYIVLSPDRKDVRHIYIYQQEDGAVVNEGVPGSEYVEALSFDVEARLSEDGGGRLLRVFAKSAYGSEGNVKTVDLDRTIFVHAAQGVLGENATKPVAGPVLRYRLNVPPPDLQVYGSRSEHTGETFDDYKNPDTWKSLKSGFNYSTELDARLTLPTSLVSTDEKVFFTWIAADPTIFQGIMKDAGRDPKAILEKLEECIPGYLNAELGESLLDGLYKGQKTDDDGNLWDPQPEELMSELIDDPFNIGATDGTNGFRLLSVMEGEKVDGDNLNMFAVKESGGKKFNLGAVANALPQAYDLYRGAYMIIVANIPGKDSEGNLRWRKWPVYVQSGNYKDDVLFSNILDILERSSSSEFGGVTILSDDRAYRNMDSNYGTMTLVNDTNRRYFEVKGSSGGSARGPLVMLKFNPEDFAHMIPKWARTPGEVLYGPTNYAVYIDIELDDVGAGGGFGVLLNGSKVNATNGNYNASTEYRSGGYIFQFDPGNNGLGIRYYCYDGNTYGERGVGGVPDGGTLSWGVRPMYFYDAAKKTLPAPKAISFFKETEGADIGRENFNENAGAAADASLNYRLPFSVLPFQNNGKRGYYDDIIVDEIFTAALEGRNGPFQDRVNNSAVGYGMMYGQDNDGYTSAYSPKHMQSWHYYNDTTISDMLRDGQDTRRGYRWDRSWNMHHKARSEKMEEPITLQRSIWEQRHILKLTVLEVTRDIKASEVDSEWKFRIHHDGEKTVTENNLLTPLGDDEVIHKAGDVFIRAELIQLKKGATDWNNSRNYIYSKPVWFGKFKGDAWRGDDPSPFKKLGNTLQHAVANPEPKEGDDQSYRRRGMRVRSWKESFLGWDFSRVNTTDYRYIWRDFVNGGEKRKDEDDPFGVEWFEGSRFPPDFFKTDYGADGRVDTSQATINTVHSVWTPPVAIDLNAEEEARPFDNDIEIVAQSGSSAEKTFGQYMYANQYVTRQRKEQPDASYAYAYDGSYTDKIYGRLSVLRPWRDTLPNQTTPIFGLYGMRGWDFGSSRGPMLNSNWGTDANSVYDEAYEASTATNLKRFLTVLQGLQLPYRPLPDEPGYRRDPASPNDSYTPNRDRVLGFRFWKGLTASVNSTYRLYDTWIGEGFSPREVRAILGLTANDDEEESIQYIRGTYVHSDMEDAGFYAPLEEEESEDE
jgi:hypothetical protein